jgi:hypothetical protein
MAKISVKTKSRAVVMDRERAPITCSALQLPPPLPTPTAAALQPTTYWQG